MTDYKQKTSQELAEVVELFNSAPDAQDVSPATRPRWQLRKIHVVLAGLLILAAAIGSTWYASKPQCDIKAVARKDGRFYYLPTDKYYKQVKVKDQTGDRYFCTEQEALNDGWAKKQYDSKKPHQEAE
ncbi:MAG: hypothetical protein SFX19_01540 [Alphaproteobacteria bacterium]|nr:hypothetical protein [Alphaproteobacteria bacterium]